MPNNYDIIEEKLCYPDLHPYYNRMMMKIQKETHPITELHIVRRRRRGGWRESQSPGEGVAVDGF